MLCHHRNRYACLTHVSRPPTNIPVQFASDMDSSGSFPRPSVPSSPASYPQFNSSVSTGVLTERDRSYPTSSSRPNPYPSSIESLIPQKLQIERNVLSLPLTRPQLCIYFLVDGRRTVADISRTIGKSIQEVERILSELQEQGLISV